MDIIFDIDDTLFTSEHRSHLYKRQDTDWELFYNESLKDRPIVSSISMLKSLYSCGHTILLVTGRHEFARDKTLTLLRYYNIPFDRLYMRPSSDKDSRNAQVKLSILKTLRKDGFFPIAAFEDNPLSAEMWKSQGLTVYQVLHGLTDKTSKNIVETKI
jgi:hypothetical protein